MENKNVQASEDKAEIFEDASDFSDAENSHGVGKREEKKGVEEVEKGGEEKPEVEVEVEIDEVDSEKPEGEIEVAVAVAVVDSEKSELETPEPVFDGTEREVSVWPDKAAAIKNYFVERGGLIRRLSEEKGVALQDALKRFTKKDQNDNKQGTTLGEGEGEGDWSAWNPVSLVRSSLEGITIAPHSNPDPGHNDKISPSPSPSPSPYKGRISLYTCLESPQCRAARSFLRGKGLRYVEINVDIFPGRKAELEKRAGSSSVPKLFLNDMCFGGINEMRELDDKGEFDDQCTLAVETEAPESSPQPPCASEDEFGSMGMVDDLVGIIRKLKKSLVVKDRFYKLRLFSKCFVGSEAVDIIAEDQLLERDEAVELGRKLGVRHFFHDVVDETTFEDGNHLYRFLEHDPIISSKCFNFSGITNELKPRPIEEIASKLRTLTLAIYEAYISDDGKHVDYRGIGASQEFLRYLKVIEDLQRVDIHDLSRMEKLAFFINLYNMMAIHQVILWGYPDGALERRKFFGDFRYVIGGYAYSLSAIQNGILRANQRPPYNLIKPFGLKDMRLKVALEFAEPLVHFALVSGSKSSPAIRCYSPGTIEEELRIAARIFFDDGGFQIDTESKTTSVSQILKWFSIDFGKNETEVLTFVATYLEPSKSEKLLELLNNNQLKVTYQNYDWNLNL